MTIYTVIAGGKVLRYPSLALLKKLHGDAAAYQVVTDADMQAAAARTGAVRLYAHNGRVVMGRTQKEAEAIVALKEIDAAQRELEGIDREFGHRANRGLGLGIARASGVPETDEDYKRLCDAEQRAAALRLRMAELKAGLGA